METWTRLSVVLTDPADAHRPWLRHPQSTQHGAWNAGPELGRHQLFYGLADKLAGLQPNIDSIVAFAITIKPAASTEESPEWRSPAGDETCALAAAGDPEVRLRLLTFCDVVNNAYQVGRNALASYSGVTATSP